MAWSGRTAYGRFSATTVMLRPPLSRILALASSPAAPFRSRHRPQMVSACFAGSPARKARLRGVVFDMDGTLTVPAIDFGAMYREVLGEETYTELRSAAPHGSIDILHHIETWAPPAQQKAYEIIARFEREGLERLQIMPGAAELCGFLDAQQVKRGLITRNVKDSVDLFHALFGMEFIPALSREFRPYKPDPAPLLHICSTWNVHPSEVMMIGDSLRDDIMQGLASGFRTYVGGNLVTWRSKKQSVVARSSAEAEYRSMAQTTCEMMWLKSLMADFGVTYSEPMVMRCDNQAAIHIVKNPIFHERTKHIEVDCHFVRDVVMSQKIITLFTPIEVQLADLFTKALRVGRFHVLCDKLGMFDIYAPA